MHKKIIARHNEPQMEGEEAACVLLTFLTGRNRLHRLQWEYNTNKRFNDDIESLGILAEVSTRGCGTAALVASLVAKQ